MAIPARGCERRARHHADAHLHGGGTTEADIESFGVAYGIYSGSARGPSRRRFLAARVRAIRARPARWIEGAHLIFRQRNASALTRENTIDRRDEIARRASTRASLIEVIA